SLGIAPDVDAAVAAALTYGKDGSLVDRANAWIDALRGVGRIPFAMRPQNDALDRWVASAAVEIDRAPVAGQLRVGAKGLEVTHPELGRIVDRPATVLDHPGKSAKFRLNAEQVVSVIPSESGVRIDQEKLRALFLDELVRPAGASREIAAPAAVDKSAFTTEQANELAAKISRTSTFTTSYPPSFSRHANISTGASQFDGVV